MSSSGVATHTAVAIIGAGISGLVCAYELKKRGHPVVLLEQTDRVGGVIQTERRRDCLVEHGPQSFQSSERLEQLLAELGLEAELIRAHPRAARYVYFRGRLHPAPLGPAGLFTTPLLSLRAKLRILREPFVPRGNRSEESVADFVRRRFGAEFLERVVEPFLSGVYAGDPERLSLPAVFPELARLEADFGSVLRGLAKTRKDRAGARRGLCSFRAGLSLLPETLAARLGGAVCCRARVLSVRRLDASQGPRYQLEIEHTGQLQSLEAAALLLAASAWDTARLLRDLAPRVGQLLGSLEFAPLAVVWLRYRRNQIPHFPAGFGFLVPRTEGLGLLGTVFSSELFPGRAPADSVCFTSFVGGLAHPEMQQLSDSVVIEHVENAHRKILGVEGPALPLGLHRYDRALPQYNLGHCERRESFREEARADGLFLAGNYLDGVSIAHCVDQAAHTAEQLAHFLRASGGWSREHI